jgi:hypothetical protein
VPSTSDGQYLWSRTIVNYSDGSSTTTYGVSKNGEHGSVGASAVWFTGTDVTGTSTSGISVTVAGSKSGDMYLNASTYDVYKATDANTWGYVCNIKGDTGKSAGFGTPKVTVDSNVGTPSVSVTAEGEDTAKVFSFDFKNLKGQPGEDAGFGTPTATAVALSADSDPTATVTASGDATAKVFSFTFGIPKGGQGSRGSIWYYGTALTHTSDTASLSDDIEHIVGDMYLNTTTGYTYRCTTAGTNTDNAWTYIYGMPYTVTLTTSSNWKTDANNGGVYFYIDASTHGKGATPNVTTYVKATIPSTSTSSTKIWAQTFSSPYIDDNGNVYITANSAMELKVVIK